MSQGEDEDILIDLASFGLSHLDHGNANIAPYLEKLEEIENRVCHLGRSAFLPRKRVAVLSRVLHDELGFVGDADFIRCSTCRGGLPIALLILYVAMARRDGWSTYVLNLPGHVLVQIGEKSPVVIDPLRARWPSFRTDGCRDLPDLPWRQRLRFPVQCRADEQS